MDPRFVEVEHRPLAGVIGQRRQQPAGCLSAEWGEQESLLLVNSQDQVDKSVAHVAHVIEEDDWLWDARFR
jgi:hypothetical protein